MSEPEKNSEKEIEETKNLIIDEQEIKKEVIEEIVKSEPEKEVIEDIATIEPTKEENIVTQEPQQIEVAAESQILEPVKSVEKVEETVEATQGTIVEATGEADSVNTSDNIIEGKVEQDILDTVKEEVDEVTKEIKSDEAS